jgi:PKD repeat protein
VRRATNGGADFDPTGTARGGISVGGVRPEGDFTDLGPADHGAHLDLGLGALAPGERKTVYFYYGAAAGEPAALAAVTAVGARVYAFGQAAPDGTPVTFIMAYKAQSNASPVAVTNGPFDVTLGAAVQLSAAGSSDPDGDALSYAWNFGDGTTGSGRDVSHTYAQPGAYTVSLAVTDAQGATAGATTTVVVRQPTAENRAPVAALTPSAASVAVGAPAVFTTSATDPDGDAPLACVIEAGDGSAPVTLSGCGAGFSHSYAQPGSYTVRLTARDPAGATGVATAVVTVAAPDVNRAPEVYNLIVADGRGQPYAGPLSAGTKSCRSADGTSQYTTCVKFGFRDADGSADAPWAARVDWGDGTAWTPNSLPAQYASLLAPHDYAAPGTYTVRVRVTDRRGLTGEQTITLVVTAPGAP